MVDEIKGHSGRSAIEPVPSRWVRRPYEPSSYGLFVGSPQDGDPGKFCSLRRLVGLLAFSAALASVASAGATLTAVDHRGARVRMGTLSIPPHHADGRVRVIVGLQL